MLGQKKEPSILRHFQDASTHSTAKDWLCASMLLQNVLQIKYESMRRLWRSKGESGEECRRPNVFWQNSKNCREFAYECIVRSEARWKAVQLWKLHSWFPPQNCSHLHTENMSMCWCMSRPYAMRVKSWSDCCDCCCSWRRCICSYKLGP